MLHMTLDTVYQNVIKNTQQFYMSTSTQPDDNLLETTDLKFDVILQFIIKSQGNCKTGLDIEKSCGQTWYNVQDGNQQEEFKVKIGISVSNSIYMLSLKPTQSPLCEPTGWTQCNIYKLYTQLIELRIMYSYLSLSHIFNLVLHWLTLCFTAPTPLANYS